MAVQVNASIVCGTGQPTYTDGWPEGATVVANLKSCVGWWEGPPLGGGESHILFRGDTEAFTEALTNFAAVRVSVLDLVIHDGPKHDQFLKLDVDWELVIWNPPSWNQRYNSTNEVNQRFFAGDPNFHKPVPAPRLEVYISGGGVDWTKVKIPPNLKVRDERTMSHSENRQSATGNRP